MENLKRTEIEKQIASGEAFTLDKFEKAMIDAWPTPLVKRRQVEKFSFGALSASYLGSNDHQGVGPQRLCLARNTLYPKEALARWICQRLKEKGELQSKNPGILA